MKRVAEIKVLTQLEAVRMRPEMYLGALDAEGLQERLIEQGLCHAVDEALDGHCTEVKVGVYPAGVRIEYDASMPVEIHHGEVEALLLLYRLRGCHNRKKHIEVGDELCELGLAVLNACCRRFFAATVSQEGGYQFEFRRGCLIEQTVEDRAQAPWTCFEFELDTDLLGEFQPVSAERLRARALEMSRVADGFRVVVEEHRG